MRKALQIGAVAMIAGFATCLLMAKAKSFTVTNKTAGLNGGFEVVESGLPVNWLFYTPQTAASGDFKISADAGEFHSGGRSLKFAVRECSRKGGHYSPGFSQQFKASPGERYAIRFWVKNEGCKFRAKIGGVSAFRGDYRTMAESSETFDGWRQYAFNYTIPAEMNGLRFELNVLEPGTLWIDDVEIEKAVE